MGSVDLVGLLREEHLQLQSKYADLQQKFAVLQTRIDPSQPPDASTLAGQLVTVVRNLFDNHSLSDVAIRVSGFELKCHKFLLMARSNHWSHLETRDYVEFPEISLKAFEVVYRWMYTDTLPRSQLSTEVLKEVAHIAYRFGFVALQPRCVQLLKTSVNVTNCISLFEFADEEDIVELRDFCSAIVAAHWHEFKPQQFSHLSAPSLFRLLKKNSQHVLHSIIQLNREDVLLLYFIENDSKLHTLVNTPDQRGLSPLELALISGHVNIATQLLNKDADCNAVDDTGRSILMRMIEKGDATACEFLAKSGADLKFVHKPTRSTLLHCAAASLQNPTDIAAWIASRLGDLDIDAADEQGRTAALLSIINENHVLTDVLLQHGADVEKADNAGNSPLSVALFDIKNMDLSRKLVELGGPRILNHIVAKDCLLHTAVRKEDFEVVRFLLANNAEIDATNDKGETPLWIAVALNNLELVSLLLDKGAAVRTSTNERESVLHKAVLSGSKMLKIFAEKTKGVDWSCGILRYALDQHLVDCAKVIVSAGANVEAKDSLGNTLLLQRILLSDDIGATFLLEHGAKHSVKDSLGRSPLELAAYYGLINTLKTICGLGININERSNGGSGYTVLKQALSEGHYECASLLVSLGCDLESSTIDGSYVQTMLHHFIDVEDERAAVFLIESGCNGDAMRVPRDPSEHGDQLALHRAVTSGMVSVVSALVKAKVNLSAQDSNGRTACHVAVQQRNSEVLSELLNGSDLGFLSIRDKFGQTPFSQALFTKEHALAAAIVERQPHVALLANGNGENLLHTSVKSNDLESVLFLLSSHTDATRVTTDGTKRSALHYAANVDNELILRNLLLAGCEVDVRSADGTTPLHIAARFNRAVHAEILLENGANPNIVDERGDNALLQAVRTGSVDCVKALTSHTSTDSLAVNKSGQSALHLCATLTSDKLPPKRFPVEICELLLRREAHRLQEKEFAAYVDLQNAEGNTALLSAYMAGNGEICRCLLRYGATMGARNVVGATMFTYETPTRLLLFRLLDSLEREPRWSDGDMCDCGVRFSITVRKHHCRHCGRLVCSKCSEITMPIAKFGEEKRVRVCSLCAEVLTTGGAQ